MKDMQIAIIASTIDTAGMNMLKAFENMQKSIKLKRLKLTTHAIDKETIYAEQIDEKIKADAFIFLSKHKAEKHIKTLCVHSCGNFGRAEFGGKQAWLNFDMPVLKKLIAIHQSKIAARIGFTASLEVTHHGPALHKPCLFVEVGSTHAEWNNKQACKANVQALSNALKQYEEAKNNYQIAIGFGGKHYCQGFNAIETNTNIALSHICPAYAIEFLDKVLLEQMIHHATRKAEIALLDWKGMKTQQRQKIVNLIKQYVIEKSYKLEIIKTKQVKKQQNEKQ